MDKKKQKKNAINFWPESDRPREKLLAKGEHTLSDSELLAILLRTGNRGMSALDLARRIMDKFSSFRAMSHTDLSLWKEFKGLGKAKLAQIRAAIEIGRRFGEQEAKIKKTRIKSSKDVVSILMPRLRDLKKELFKVVLLDAKNMIIDICEIEQGTVNQAHPIIREVFQQALQREAVSLICSHNHPSGDPAPSREDKSFTAELCRASEIMQVRMLDHIIIGDDCYYSFADSGEL